MWYSSSSGKIELNIPEHVIPMGYHTGQCDADIATIRQTETELEAQLQTIPHDVLVAELREYGAWDEDELSDHDANLDRILWLACGDLYDEQMMD